MSDLWSTATPTKVPTHLALYQRNATNLRTYGVLVRIWSPEKPARLIRYDQSFVPGTRLEEIYPTQLSPFLVQHDRSERLQPTPKINQWLSSAMEEMK